MKRRAAAVALLAVLAGGPALAVSDPAEMLPNPAQEARAEAIGRRLRCLVCQNESIEDSGADLARDLRRIVREQVAAGEPDSRVVGFLVQRYGDFVRLSPPFKWQTAVLWASPALALLAGLFAAWSGRRRQGAGPAPLSEAERARLAELTRAGGG